MSKQLHFTEDGYLTPIDGIETDLATFKKTFVDDFPFSEQRHFLFHIVSKDFAEQKQMPT